MADFCQSGSVTTLHRLQPDIDSRLENELIRYSRRRGVGLVIPALYAEFERPAMLQIVRELREARFLRRIVVPVGRATRGEFEQAMRMFEDFTAPVTMLWLDDPRLQTLLAGLEDRGIATGPAGKGQACWLSFGLLLADGECEAIALQDADVVNYRRRMLARLCYPVVHPELDFQFVKAYYPRISAGSLHGRVTRLFLAPLIEALRGLVPSSEFLDFLAAFRFALAGEFALKTSLAEVCRIPADWGLEVGVLAEVLRHARGRSVCQVDLADNYDHKHHPLSEEDPACGLRRMSLEIAITLFRALSAEGAVLGSDHYRALGVRYERLAEDMVDRYQAEAVFNGLDRDRHGEETAVQVFTRSIRDASERFRRNASGACVLSSWQRVSSAAPGVTEDLKCLAVELSPRRSLMVVPSLEALEEPALMEAVR